MHLFLLLTTITLLFFYEIECGKLEVCIPKKDKPVNEIPSLDKILKQFEDQNEITIEGPFSIDLNFETFTGTVDAADLVIKDFLDLEVTYFPQPLVPLNVTIKNMSVYAGYYNMSGDIANLFDLTGYGTFEIGLERFSIALTNLLPSLKHPLKCITIDIGVDIQKMTSNFENLMDGSDIVQDVFNTIIGDLGKEVIQTGWPKIYAKLIDPLQKIIDKFINNRKELAEINTYILDNFFGNSELEKKTVYYP